MKKLVNKFLEFENNEELFDIKIKGIKIWEYVRETVFNEILQKKGLMDSPGWHRPIKKYFLKKILTKVKNLIEVIIILFSGNVFWNLKKKDILFISFQRKIIDNNKIICKYTDQLLKKINYSYYIIENKFLGIKYLSKKIKFDKFFYINSLINNTFKFKKNKIKKLSLTDFNDQEILLFKDIIIKLNNLFKINIELNNSIFIREILKVIFDYYFYIDSYKYFLDRVRPKAIIYISYTGLNRKIFTKLAKERKIATIELQHGWINDHTVSYNFFKKIEIESFPEYIFLFGEVWKNKARFPINNSNLIVIGFPYFEKKLKEYKNLKRKESAFTDKIILLFISDDTTGISLSKLAVKLAKIIDKNKYKIIYKLHPNEYVFWRNSYNWLVNNNDIEVISDSNIELYYLFSISDVQIGVYSTALFEGIGFNLKTFIYKIEGYQFMELLYKNNLAELISSEKDIINRLNKKSNLDYDVLNKSMWEENSLNNMLNAIDKIIKI